MNRLYSQTVQGSSAASASTARAIGTRAIVADSTQDAASRKQSLWDQPDIVIHRRMRHDLVRVMPDGRPLRFWAFEDPVAGSSAIPPLHSPLIRLCEGQRANIALETLHFDGKLDPEGGPAIERLTYQWQPATSGTWFYQSHTGRPLDFEMGLYGVTVVDPVTPAGEPRRAYAGGPQYDVERFLVFDDVDPAWHDHDFTAAVEPGRFQTFNPRYFLINDIPNTEVAHHPDVAITACRGQSVLLRLMNASYSVVTVAISKLNSHVVCIDGHPVAGVDRPWARWIPVKGGQGVCLATASRHDLLIDLTDAESGEYEIAIEFQDRQRRVCNLNAAHPAHVGRAVTTLRVL